VPASVEVPASVPASVDPPASWPASLPPPSEPPPLLLPELLPLLLPELLPLLLPELPPLLPPELPPLLPPELPPELLALPVSPPPASPDVAGVEELVQAANWAPAPASTIKDARTTERRIGSPPLFGGGDYPSSSARK
jgi:hypothetical protein